MAKRRREKMSEGKKNIIAGGNVNKCAVEIYPKILKRLLCPPVYKYNKVLKLYKKIA